MNTLLKGWLIGSAVCLLNSCASSNQMGSTFSPLLILAFFLVSIVVYEIFFARNFYDLLKKLEPKKPEIPDINSLVLKVEHHDIRIRMLEQTASGINESLVFELQQEKFDMVDLLNEARKIVVMKNLPKDKKVTKEEHPLDNGKKQELEVQIEYEGPRAKVEKAIPKIEDLIRRLDDITAIALS